MLGLEVDKLLYLEMLQRSRRKFDKVIHTIPSEWTNELYVLLTVLKDAEFYSKLNKENRDFYKKKIKEQFFKSEGIVIEKLGINYIPALRIFNKILLNFIKYERFEENFVIEVIEEKITQNYQDELDKKYQRYQDYLDQRYPNPQNKTDQGSTTLKIYESMSDFNNFFKKSDKES